MKIIVKINKRLLHTNIIVVAKHTNSETPYKTSYYNIYI